MSREQGPRKAGMRPTAIDVGRRQRERLINDERTEATP